MANYNRNQQSNYGYNQPYRDQNADRSRFATRSRDYDDMAEFDYDDEEEYMANEPEWEGENYYGRSNDNRMYRYGEGSRGNRGYGNRQMPERSRMSEGRRDQDYSSHFGEYNDRYSSSRDVNMNRGYAGSDVYHNDEVRYSQRGRMPGQGRERNGDEGQRMRSDRSSYGYDDSRRRYDRY